MLSLAETSIRLYRKKNRKIALHLRSHLLVKTNVGFRLNAYLKNISCKLTLPSGDIITFDEVSITDDLICKYEWETMVHGFSASAIGDIQHKDSIGKLRVDYLVSFTGHPYEKPKWFEIVVPLIKKRTWVDAT